MKDFYLEDDKTVFIRSAHRAHRAHRVLEEYESETLALFESDKTKYIFEDLESSGSSEHLEVPVPSELPLQHTLTHLTGPNDLLKYAGELFLIHDKLQKEGYVHQLEALKTEVQEGLMKFELRAQKAGYTKSLIKSTQYVLCTFLDETVMSKPWAQSVNFSHQTFLSQRFNETWGGETVFRIRQYCLDHIVEYLPLLELIYVCLCLGFQGRFAIQEEGDLQLTRMKHETYRVIQESHQASGHLAHAEIFMGQALEMPLGSSPQAPSKQGVKWVFYIALSVLVVVYTGLSLVLSESSHQVIEQIHQQQASVNVRIYRHAHDF